MANRDTTFFRKIRLDLQHKLYPDLTGVEIDALRGLIVEPLNDGLPLDISSFETQLWCKNESNAKPTWSDGWKGDDGLLYLPIEPNMLVKGTTTMQVSIIKDGKRTRFPVFDYHSGKAIDNASDSESVGAWQKLMDALIAAKEKAAQDRRAAEIASEQANQARLKSCSCATNACECATQAESAQESAQQSASSAYRLATQAKSAQESAQLAESNAKNYATQAEEAKKGAQGGVTEATNQAKKAEEAAKKASQSEENASESATEASEYRSKAKGHAESASTSAEAASTSASEASQSAQTAQMHAESAETAKTSASNSANAASESATNAKQSANNAASAETEATRQAGLASDSASNAKTSETNAKASETVVLGVEDELTQVIDEARAATEAANNAAQETQPFATKTSAGIVQVGEGLSITETGILSADAPDLTEELDTKIDKEDGKRLMTDAESTKLSGIEEGANKYVHPTKHQISEVDGLQLALDNAGTKELATPSSNGLMSSSDKTKLNGIEEGANNYKHPDTHSISEIDGLQEALDNAGTKEVATTTSDGLMSSADKNKLDGIEEGATKTEIVDSLASLTGTKALSDKQGALLKQEIGEKTNAPSVKATSLWSAIEEAKGSGGSDELGVAMVNSELQNLITVLKGV